MKYLILLIAMISQIASADMPSSGHTHAVPPTIVDIRVVSGDLFFRIDGRPEHQPMELTVGKRYRITFVNVGSMEHEVLFGRNSSINEDGTPGDYQENMLTGFQVKVKGKYKDQSGREIVFEVEAPGLDELELSPGAALSVIFTVPDSLVGDWEVGCFMPGHYMAGMKLSILVRR